MVNYLAGTTVLVGIDFSEHSERALQRAVALAEANGAQIELVHVFEWPDELAPTAGKAPLRTDRANSGLWNAAMTLAQASRSRLGRLCSTIVGDRATAGIRVVLDAPARGTSTGGAAGVGATDRARCAWARQSPSASGRRHGAAGLCEQSGASTPGSGAGADWRS